jgi:hypothetical protein
MRGFFLFFQVTKRLSRGYIVRGSWGAGKLFHFLFAKRLSGGYIVMGRLGVGKIFSFSRRPKGPFPPKYYEGLVSRRPISGRMAWIWTN